MIIVPEFSFVTFDGNGDSLPYKSISDLIFQVESNDVITSIRMVDQNGSLIQESSNAIIASGNNYLIRPFFDLTPDCFKIQLMSGATVLGTSNTFVLTTDKYTSQLMYRCDNNEFGFIYCPQYFINSIRLPFYLRSPQFPQEQTIYEKLNGRKRVLSANVGKEYVLETDYMPEEMHQKLIVALINDDVFIDGKLMTKTDDYSIDWSDTFEIEGVRTAKGQCTMSMNIVNRNSNCGDSCQSLDFDVQPRSLEFEAV